MDIRPSIEEIYMMFAIILSFRSTCKRSKTAAIITSRDLRRIYSVGYNGSPHKFPHNCTGLPGRCGCIHAELNALLKVQVYDPEKIMFTIMSPCPTCAKYIIQSGFSKIYYLKQYRKKQGLKLLNQAGIQTEKITIRPEIVKQFTDIIQNLII